MPLYMGFVNLEGKMKLGPTKVLANLTENKELAVVKIELDTIRLRDGTMGWQLYGMQKIGGPMPERQWTVVHVRSQLMIHNLAAWGEDKGPAVVAAEELGQHDWWRGLNEHGKFEDQVAKVIALAEIDAVIRALI